MKITVNDCLKLPSFKNAEVLACKDKLGINVKNITILETKNTEKIAKYYKASNQIFLTAFFDIEDNVIAQCNIVEEIARFEDPILVLQQVKDNPIKIDNKVISRSEALGVVFIALDPNQPVESAEVVHELSESLFYGSDEQFENKLITNTIFHLLNFDKYVNFESAIRAAAVNNAFQMVLLSTDFNPVLTIETKYRATVDQAIRLGRDKNVEDRTSVFTTIDVEGVMTYWGPAKIQDITYYMIIVDNEDCYSKAEISMLAEVLKLAMGMWKYTPLRDQKAELIKALRRGNMSIAYAMKEEADVQEGDIASVFLGTGFKSSRCQKIIDEFCKEENMKSLQVSEGDETYGMLLGKRNDLVCTSLYDRLKKEDGVRIYHITGMNDLEGAGDGYRLINEAYSFAEYVFPFKRVFSKYELAMISSCVNLQLRGGFVRKNYAKLIEPFDIKNREKDKQLLESLETFVLDAGMNSTKTAEIMHVHVNTVQYRLKRISEILGAEITGTRVAPGLTIALALSRLEKASDSLEKR